MKTAKIILVALIALSCSSKWHLQKAIAKDPTILETKTITVWDTTTFSVPEIRIKDSVVVVYDSVAVDSEVSQAADISIEQARITRNIIINHYNRLLAQDTARADTLNVEAVAYFKDGILFLEFTQADTTYTKPVKVDVVHDQLVYKPQKWYEGVYGVLKVIFLVLLLLLLAYLVVRQLIK